MFITSPSGWVKTIDGVVSIWSLFELTIISSVWVAGTQSHFDVSTYYSIIPVFWLIIEADFKQYYI